jgi:tRNA pseudouridine55 synthase
MDQLSAINQIKRDEFDRPSGIIAVNKPAGKSSHDIVDTVRKIMHTRRVGHAGALDQFATGVLIILVGKATKLSNTLINLDKSYRAKIVFGISTETQDIEGKPDKIEADAQLNQKKLQQALKKFTGKIRQFVSVFSSVKVGGKKLRIIMRDERFSKEIVNEAGKRFIKFTPETEGPKAFEVEVPAKEITIAKSELLEQGNITADQLPYQDKLKPGSSYPFVTLQIDCSKGTYIRQLAEDIGAEVGLPAFVLELERSRVGSVSLAQCYSAEQLETAFTTDKTAAPAV